MFNNWTSSLHVFLSSERRGLLFWDLERNFANTEAYRSEFETNWIASASIPHGQGEGVLFAARRIGNGRELSASRLRGFEMVSAFSAEVRTFVAREPKEVDLSPLQAIKERRECRLRCKKLVLMRFVIDWEWHRSVWGIFQDVLFTLLARCSMYRRVKSHCSKACCRLAREAVSKRRSFEVGTCRGTSSYWNTLNIWSTVPIGTVFHFRCKVLKELMIKTP